MSERIGHHSCDSYFKITAIKHAKQEAVKWEGNTSSPKANIRRYKRDKWQIFKSSTGRHVQNDELSAAKDFTLQKVGIIL
jgi:hypothetical protein